MDVVRKRALQLIQTVGPKHLSELGGKNYERWRSISGGKIGISTEEVGILADAYPQYALWLISERIEPEHGHLSPDCEVAGD